MSIINKAADVAVYRDRWAVRALGRAVAMEVARRLPRTVALYAVVHAANAAVQIREADPERRTGSDGPDGIDYRAMHDAIAGVPEPARYAA